MVFKVKKKMLSTKEFFPRLFLIIGNDKNSVIIITCELLVLFDVMKYIINCQNCDISLSLRTPRAFVAISGMCRKSFRFR